MQESLRDELEKLGIYQLRMYARRVGVKLATTLKKADLIDAILQVVSGEKEPYVKKTKKGRPPKEILQIATPTMASQVATSIMGGRSYDYGFEGLASSTYAIDKKENGREENIEGVLDIFANGSGILVPLDAEGVYAYVTEDVIAKYGLRRGDIVNADTYEMNYDTNDCLPTIVGKVCKINGCEDFESVERFDNAIYESCSEVMPIDVEANNLAKAYDMSDTKIYKGDRILVVGSDRRVLPLSCFNIASLISTNKNIKIVVVMINANKNFIYAYKNLSNVTCISAKFGAEREKQFKMFELGIQYAQNLASFKGNDVVCVVPDADDILSLCETQEENDRCLSILKNFYASAGKTSVGSLTVAVGLSDKSAEFENFQTSENVFLKACEVEDAKQLIYKFNWLASGRNELVDFMGTENGYSYLLSSFLRRGNQTDRQKQIEDWICLNYRRDEIIAKMKEFLTSENA